MFCGWRADHFRADKTYDAFSGKMTNLQIQHADTNQQLRDKIRSLRSETEERIKFTETQPTWTNYSTTKAVPAKLKTNIEGTLRERVQHESRLQELEEEMELLKAQFHSLKVKCKK